MLNNFLARFINEYKAKYIHQFMRNTIVQIACPYTIVHASYWLIIIKRIQL